MAVAARVAISQALVGPAVGTGLQRAPQSEHLHLQGRLGPGVAAARWACSTQSPFLHARPLSLGSASKMAGAPEGRSSTPRAALAESPPAVAVKDVAHQPPAASKTPLDLDVDTLQMASHAALLAALAYKTPVEVEYLRLLANGKSQEDALQEIDTQAGGKRPPELSSQAKLDQLEQDNEEHGYEDALSQFTEPSQYFDGKQSLFMKATEAYIFYCPTPEGQRNVLYCVFRGTEGLEDDLADLQLGQVQIAPKPPAPAKKKLSADHKPAPSQDRKPVNPIEHIKDIKIHRGFRDQFVAVATALTRNVEDAAREVKEKGAAVADNSRNFEDRIRQQTAADGVDGFEVVVTGHSLGAALATIGSFMAALEHPRVPVHYFGFGSPRVGNAAFAEAYEKVSPNLRAVHFANRNDPVPGMPTPPGYVHVHGGHMLYPEDGRVKAMCLESEKNAFMSTTVQWLKNITHLGDYLFKNPASQHDMGLYVKRVRALLQQKQAGK